MKDEMELQSPKDPSLRDYLAAAVIPAIFMTYAPIVDPGQDKIAIMAKAAYDIADAMLKAREK